MSTSNSNNAVVPLIPENWGTYSENQAAGATSADPSITTLPRTVDDYARLIGFRWNSSLDAILKTCALCADARHALGVSSLRSLVTKLSFSASTFSKLAKIGADSRMHRDDVCIHLPPDYSTLYIICGLSDIKLDAALKDGVIRPDMRRKDLEDWIKPPKVEPEDEEDLPEFATILVRSDFTVERRRLLQRSLRRLADEFPEIEVHGANSVWTAVANPEARNETTSDDGEVDLASSVIPSPEL